jgi:hypothetical protein
MTIKTKLTKLKSENKLFRSFPSKEDKHHKHKNTPERLTKNKHKNTPERLTKNKHKNTPERLTKNKHKNTPERLTKNKHTKTEIRRQAWL